MLASQPLNRVEEGSHWIFATNQCCVHFQMKVCYYVAVFHFPSKHWVAQHARDITLLTMGLSILLSKVRIIPFFPYLFVMEFLVKVMAFINTPGMMMGMGFSFA